TRAGTVSVTQAAAGIAAYKGMTDGQLAAQFAGGGGDFGHGFSVKRYEEGDRSRQCGPFRAVFSEGVQDAFHAESPADAGRVAPAEAPDEAVAASAAAQGGLGADAGMVDLEGGAPVVVEPPDDGRVEFMRDVPQFQEFPHACEMRGRFGIEEIK